MNQLKFYQLNKDQVNELLQTKGIDAEFLDSYEVEDIVEELITEIYGTIEIGSLKYDAGRILREVDPIAFNEEVNNEINYKDEDDIWIELLDSTVLILDSEIIENFQEYL